jgi:hypothetical protein
MSYNENVAASGECNKSVTDISVKSGKKSVVSKDMDERIYLHPVSFQNDLKCPYKLVHLIINCILIDL